MMHALINAGILPQSTPEFREGMLHGEMVGGVLCLVWGAGRGPSTAPSQPPRPTPATAGGAPAPPLVVVPNGAAVVVGAGGIVNVAAAAGEMTAALSNGGAGNGGPKSGGRVTGDALKAARAEFNQIKPRFWKNEATWNAGQYSSENLARMREGKAPIGPDGHPMELHHRTPLAEGGANTFDNLQPLSRTDHRLGPNYKFNHPDLP